MIALKEKILSEIESLLKKYDGKTPGIAVMAVQRGQIIFQREYGLANLEHNIPIKSNTVFNLASISKQFTAMAIMMLVEKGRLKYEDKMTTYLPELSHFCNLVTIRHLLNNRSGIENYYRLLARLNKSPIYLCNREIYDLLVTENKLLFEPGTYFDYSNSNYVLLARIIEVVTKATFQEYLQENIFDKLGMNETMIFDERQPLVLNRAYGYRKEKNDFYCDYVEALTIGDGGVFSTIENLYLWDQALYTEKLVCNQTMKLAFSAGQGENGSHLEEEYGFGWSISVENGLKKVWHSGLDAGFRTLITRYLSEQFTVIILSNSADCTWVERKQITEKLYEFHKASKSD